MLQIFIFNFFVIKSEYYKQRWKNLRVPTSLSVSSNKTRFLHLHHYKIILFSVYYSILVLSHRQRMYPKSALNLLYYRTHFNPRCRHIRLSSSRILRFRCCSVGTVFFFFLHFISSSLPVILCGFLYPYLISKFSGLYFSSLDCLLRINTRHITSSSTISNLTFEFCLL